MPDTSRKPIVVGDIVRRQNDGRLFVVTRLLPGGRAIIRQRFGITQATITVAANTLTYAGHDPTVQPGGAR